MIILSVRSLHDVPLYIYMYHYTKIIVVRACVRASVRTDGSSPEAS